MINYLPSEMIFIRFVQYYTHATTRHPTEIRYIVFFCSQPKIDEIIAKYSILKKLQIPQVKDLISEKIKMPAKPNVADKFQILTDIEHVLHRPDTYIGSSAILTDDVFICDIDSATPKIIKKKISFIPGLERIYEEVLLNAFDQTVREGTGCNEISVDIDQSNGSITVINNGQGIPVVMKDELKCYIPEMIFGMLRTGENYDDDSERLTGGKNGLGSKLSNIFSTEFSLETIDSERKKHYVQSWTDHMDKKTEPVIKTTRKKPMTRVTFKPDLKYFKLESLTDDIVMLMKKRLIDIGFASHAGVKTYYNGTLITIKKPEDYMKLYSHPEGVKFIVDSTCERWTVGVALSNEGFQHAAFANGIHTSLGGSHVDHVANQVAKEIIDKLKTKKIVVKPSDVKNKMFVFIRSAIVNPLFDSQSKECLKMSKTKFGSEFIMSDAFRKKLLASDIFKSMTEVADSKKLKDLSKTSGVKTSRLTDMDTLEDATWAGTAKGLKARLILTEGLSARTFAISALNVIGRERFGVFPLKGKLLNVRNVAINRVSANEEIKNIVKILGMKYDLTYETPAEMNTLRYGGVVCLTDADTDGIHICGLIINYFHNFWPKILEKGFLSFCITPIVKVFKGKETLQFYTLNKYEEWLKTATGSYKTKYFKGLGTSTAAEAREALKDIDEKLITFERDEGCDEKVSLAFNGKRADDRKEWLMEQYNPESSIDRNQRTVGVSDFIDYELSHFSTYDCARSIPCILDGLKPSQRKIMHVALKHLTKNEIKVGQLGPLVSQMTDYHHGEQSLMGAIIGMAQTYVGTNNINLLEPLGGFGCLDPETEVMLWDGGVKMAKDITTDDKLIGDDGMIRNVIKLTSGVDQMYEIRLNNEKTFKVNSQHKLTLTYSGNKNITWKEGKKCWRVEYFDIASKKLKSKTVSTGDSSSTETYNKSSLSKQEAYDAIKSFVDELDCPDVFDIKVCDYLKLPKSVRSSLMSIINSSIIEWDQQPVEIDPYILGVWLGDGNSDGTGIAGRDFEIITSYALWADTIGCELVHDSNGTKGHETSHFSVRNRTLNKTRTSVGDFEHSKASCIGCLTSNYDLDICDWKFQKSPINVNLDLYKGTYSNGLKREDMGAHRQMFKKLGLYKNKHIPKNYIYNSKEVRLQLLAGFIDTDGCVKYQTTNKSILHSIVISQSARLRAHIIDDLYIIVRSLGFKATIGTVGAGSKTKKGEDMSLKTITITGDNLNIIPTRVQRKKIQPYTRSINSYRCGFEVIPVGEGPFNGWEVDSNHRFLLKDYVITHNSRLASGNDAASPRYIFTKLNPVAMKIFDSKDTILLKHIESDGTPIEPEWFAPVLPMILINGTLGIGTGFSTSVLQYNPIDIINYIKIMLNGDKPEKNLMPWYKGFTGNIVKESAGKYTTYAVWKFDDKKRCLHLTELPINVWTDNYKSFCEKMLSQDGSPLADVVYGNTDIIVDIKFIFKPSEYEKYKKMDHDDLVKEFKLSSKLSSTNMYLFNAEGRIERFSNVYSIIKYYFIKRFDLYVKRKAALIEQLKYEILILRNKAKFIKAVKQGDIDQKTMTEDSLLKALQKDFDADPRSISQGLSAYEYLIGMSYRSFTNENAQKMNKLVKEKENEMKELEATTTERMWINDLDEISKCL